jgi:hypothetical protein
MTLQTGDGLPGFGDQDLPLAAGSLTGVRLWHVDLASFEAVAAGTPEAVDGLLTGVFGATWRAGENVATCGGGRRPAAGHVTPVPAPRCGCGFWAYWTARDALRSDYRRAAVIGIMQGYGRCRIGTRGCRCSKARIVAVHVRRVPQDLMAWDTPSPGILPEIAETLGRFYGVPCYASLEEMLAAHPPTTSYLPRRQQPAAGPARLAWRARVRWLRVAVLATAYTAAAGAADALAAAWRGGHVLGAIIALTVASAIWPVGTRWLPRWARKLRRMAAGRLAAVRPPAALRL